MNEPVNRADIICAEGGELSCVGSKHLVPTSLIHGHTYFLQLLTHFGQEKCPKIEVSVHEREKSTLTFSVGDRTKTKRLQDVIPPRFTGNPGPTYLLFSGIRFV